MKPINWNEPSFDAKDMLEVTKVLKANYINEGPKTAELERKLEAYLGSKHVIMTCSGTAALFLAVKADMIIKNLKEFEVIVPDMTMIATAYAAHWAGGKAVLADIEPYRFTISPEEIRKKISARTSAVIPVHVLGRSANMDEIMKIAEEKNLTVIEDCAGSLGSKNENGQHLGTIGKMGCFSLQSNKIITCGQGGFVCTNDDKYAQIMRALKDFGRISKTGMHDIEGYNLKFSDLQAALALSQFNKLEARIKMLNEQREIYLKELDDLEDNIVMMKYESGEVPLWIDVIAKERDHLAEYLFNYYQIRTRKCWPALHENAPFKDQKGNIAQLTSENALWLPNGPKIKPEDIVAICKKIRRFYTSWKK